MVCVDAATMLASVAACEPLPGPAVTSPVSCVMPVSDGVAHVASPRQNVVADAPVPEPRLVTGRFPVTPVVSGKPVPLASPIDAGVPVAFVRTSAEGVPRAGVVNVGLTA